MVDDRCSLIDVKLFLSVLPALVLTAGLGTRLRPLTDLVAKPAVPLGGVTLIERILGWLRDQGVTEAVLNLHHRPETITAVVGDGAHLGLRVRYSWEVPILGSAGGPRHALPLLDTETFLIVNGDTLTDLPLAPMIARHEASGADVTLAAIANPAPDRYNGIAADGADRVTGFVPRGRAAGSWHFIGVQVVRASVFAPLADGVPRETISDLYRERLTTHPDSMYVWRTDASFLDVGTPRDYIAAALAVTGAGSAGNVIEPGARISPTARLHRTVVWANAAVGDAVDLDECVVTNKARVPDGTKAKGHVFI